MARIAFGLTLSLVGTACWLALEEFRYLAPYRDEIAARYGAAIVAYCLALAFDLFAFLYWLSRRLGLGDVGRKLRRLEGEVRRGSTFDSELADRLRDQREGLS